MVKKMDYSNLKQVILETIKEDPNAKANTKAFIRLIKNKYANYETAAEYSKMLGDVTAKAIEKNIIEGVSDEELLQFAQEVLAPVYTATQKTVLNACKSVQALYNEQAEVQLQPVDVKPDGSRITHIVDRFAEASNFDEVKFLINKNVARSITRGAVNDSMRSNAKAQSDAGLNVRISRTDGSGCCKWCSSLVGTYDSFDALPNDFWKIHRGCKCSIDYRTGKTKQKVYFKTDSKGKLEKVTEEIETEYKQREIAKDTVHLISKSDIIKMKSIDEISKYMNNIYDINLVGFKNLDAEQVALTIAGVEDIIKEYPKASETINRIIFDKKLNDYGSMDRYGTMRIGKTGIGSYTTGVHETYHAANKAYSNDSNLADIVCKKAAESIGIETNSARYKLLAFDITKNIIDISNSNEVLAYSGEIDKINAKGNSLSKAIINEFRKATE